MKKIRSVTYTYLIGDLFHSGHLKLLEQAKRAGDYHICGVISDAAAVKWNSPIICTYNERKEVIGSLECVDEVIRQDSMDPTNNLKKIHARFPKSKIVLFQGHQKWGQMPGVEFIKKIGGKIIRPEYYPRLSRENIAKAFISEAMKENPVLKDFATTLNVGNVNYFDSEFTSKADTLNNLQSSLRKSHIEPLFVFTVAQWKKQHKKIIESIRNKFNNAKIVVRSSAQNEDNFEFSNAGNFHSVLNIDAGDILSVEEAVEKVISSYRSKNADFPGNQVLVQRQTEGVVLSGVVLTRSTMLNKPYFVINYDDASSATDGVTSGASGNKIEILRSAVLSEIPERWHALIAAVKEIEELLSGLILDIEFAINDKNKIVIFQVRPLAANSRFGFFDENVVYDKISTYKADFKGLNKKKGILSKKIYLSDMAFWNPAEIIGDHPNYLDYSLYHNLILKSSWNEGLLPLGYSAVNDSLMTLMGSKPYINVHHAFLALLPEDISVGLKSKLLDHYNKKLRAHPELHDKIEFEIVHNCYDFQIGRSLEELKESGFSASEITEIKTSLLKLTNAILKNSKKIIQEDLNEIEILGKKRQHSIIKYNKDKHWKTALLCAADLLTDCRKHGTVQFARIARMAFIGKRIFNSLCARNIIGRDSYDMFLAGIPTVASKMDQDFSMLRNHKLGVNDFLNKYGHLRPSTYDINKFPYSKSRDYFAFEKEQNVAVVANVEVVSKHKIGGEEAKITRVCSEAGLEMSGKEILDFVRTSIQMREFFKFEFTKNLSEALELIAFAGAELGFERSELASLDYYSIVVIPDTANREELLNIWTMQILARKKEREINARISLPSLLFSENDLIAVQSYACNPNFVTIKNVKGKVSVLDSNGGGIKSELSGKIVVLEKADPGYDWIFTHAISGLITKYGGVASHMAIRCAEFDIPAAIGCGDIIYEKARRANTIMLDCNHRKIDFI